MWKSSRTRILPRRIAWPGAMRRGRGLMIGILVVLIGATATAQAAIPASERTVLENIYAQTSGDRWVNQSGWMGPPGSECHWDGVTCNATETTVVAINLSDKGMYGILPRLDGLTNLESFIIGQIAHGGIGPYNTLYGPIPPLNGLKNLRTFIADGMFFSGNLPSLADMSNLEHFECTYCALDGHIVALEGLTHLMYFEVSGDPLAGKLSGSIPSVADLSALEYFRVSGKFTGELPDLSGLTNLQTFDVRGFRFTGGLPDIANLPNLETFSVHGLVTGDIPPLSNLPSLQTFNVGANLLTGGIPSLAQLPELQHFAVAANRLSGGIPDLGGLDALETFGVSYNQLDGPVPAPPQSLIESGGSADYYYSGLCPNLLTPASNPPMPVDETWSAITGTVPWSQECVPDPRWETYLDFYSSLNTSYMGQPVTFVVVVLGMEPTGMVGFDARSDAPGPSPLIHLCEDVPVVDGVATCTYSELEANGSTWSLFAHYSGDEDNLPAPRTTYPGLRADTLYVKDIVTTTTTDNPAEVGQPVDLTVTWGHMLGTSDINDTVTFLDDIDAYGPNVKVLCEGVPIHISRAGRYIAHCVSQFADARPHVVTARSRAFGLAEPIIQRVADASAFDANQFALSGPWYEPSTSGQGLELVVYPDLRGDGVAALAGGSFTFDDAGEQRWYALQGPLSSAHGSSFDLLVGQGSGGNFDAPPVTAPPAVVGSATMTFYDCSHAALAYTLDGGRSGTIPYARLDPPTACSNTAPAIPPDELPAHYNDVLHGGAWYDPATSGQGLYVDLMPTLDTFFGAWFTYAPQDSADDGTARQRWFTLHGAYTPGDLSLHDGAIIETRGGVFNQPSPVDVRQVGTADITFDSCTSMTLEYSFDAGEFSGLSGSIHEQRIGGSNPACK